MDFTTFLTTLSCLPLGLWEKHFKSVEMYLGKQNLEFVELVGVDKLDDFLGQYTKDTTKRANETKKIDSIFAKCRPIYHRRLKKFFNVEEVFFNGQ